MSKKDHFSVRTKLTVGPKSYQYYRLQGIEEQGIGNISRLPFSIKVLLEAAVRQYELLAPAPRADHVLLAATRYLAAHAPTLRAQGQTYEIARRLHRGERLWEGPDEAARPG